MEKLVVREEYIKLGQAFKAAGFCERGSDAKEVILEGTVYVNGEPELRRGRKLYDGDVVSSGDWQLQICK